MRVIQKALTFDDVLLLPAHSRILPRDASLKSRLTRELELNIPLVSAAMDTVTEARLAIAIAQEGGVGIVTNRDLRFETELDQPVKNIMTPRAKLITVREGASRAAAMALMHRHRLERVLVVDEDFTLKGLVTVKDILKEVEHPHACK